MYKRQRKDSHDLFYRKEFDECCENYVYAVSYTHLQLRGVIDGLKGENGCLMPIMQKAQEIYGYLPYQVQKIISDGTGIPMEKVYGVATFYAQFSMSPKGEHEVSVCLGTACYVKGAGDIFDKVSEELQIGDGECTPDGKFSLDSCRCVGAVSYTHLLPET